MESIQEAPQKIPQTARIAVGVLCIVLYWILWRVLASYFALESYIAANIAFPAVCLAMYPVSKGYPNGFTRDKRLFTFRSWAVLTFVFSAAIALYTGILYFVVFQLMSPF
jgi:hypothetical protein